MSDGRRRDFRDFVHGTAGPVVVVPARVASILERHAGLDAFRINSRGTDPEVDAVLLGMHAVVLAWREAHTGDTTPTPDAPTNPDVSLTGTSVAAAAETEPHWMSTAQAAARAGLTARAIRYAIQRQHLTAHTVSNRWVIAPADLATYLTRNGPSP